MRIAEQSKRSIKFRQYPNSPNNTQWTEVRKTIVRIQFRIGIHEPLTESEEIELCRFLFKECKDVNRHELENAFDLYCAGKLDFKESHYNKVSNLFVGNVVGAFKRYRANELSQHKSVTYIEKPIDLNDYYTRNLFEPYESFCSTGVYPFTDLNGWILFDDLKVYFPEINADQETRIAIGQQARLVTPKKKRDSPLEKEESKEDHDRRILKVAHAMMFKRWIEECSFNETNLREIVKVLIRK